MAGQDPEIDIRIRTSADPRALDETKKQIQDVKKEAGGLGRSFTDAAKQIATAYSEAGGGIKGFAAVVSSGFGAAAAVLGSLTTGVLGAKKALDEFAKSEQQVLRLQAAMAGAGILTDELNAKYQKLAKTFKSATGENFVDVIRTLTQHGSTPDSIERDTKAVENAAGIMNDLGTATIAVAKALEGNFTLFARWGIYVDEDASKVEKLNQLYKELADRGAGQLRAAHEGLSGQTQALSNQWHGLWKNIGFYVAQTGVFQYVLTGLAGTLGLVNKAIGAVIPVADGFHNALKKNNDVAVDAERYNRQYADSLKEVSQWASAVTDSLKAQLEQKQQIRRLQDEETDANMAYQLAEVDRLEKTGGLNPAQAIANRGLIRARANGEKFAREKAMRDDAARNLQQQFDAKSTEIEEAEENARKAESAVVSEEEVSRRRERMRSKLDGEVHRWESEYAALHAAPWDYASSELGETSGPRTEADMSRASAKITAKILAARGAREKGMTDFDANTNDVVVGGRARAKAAREYATKVTLENYPQMTSIERNIEALGLDEQSAIRKERLRSKTDALNVGTNLIGQNPSINPNTVQNVQAQVVQAGQAFQGAFENFGASVMKNYETLTGAMNSMARRLKQLEDRERNNPYR